MNIVITGASNGIGYQTALLLSTQEHTVFAIARNKEKLEKLQEEALKRNVHSKLHIITGDIADENTINNLVKKISQDNQSVDVLINNAGMLINSPFEKITNQDWTDIYVTNVIAVAELINALLPLMKDRVGEKAHILNISSMGGFQGSAKFKGLSAYSSSKAALVGLTECLAEEFKDRNIAVNCLCLGSVQTEMFTEAFPQFKAANTAEEMATYIANFATEGQKFFNGKIIPVSNSTP